MSERSFAAWSVGLALVFGAVVPEPGQSPAASDARGVAVVQPVAAPIEQAAQESAQAAVLRPLQGVPLAVNHAVGRKDAATPAVLWAVHNPR